MIQQESLSLMKTIPSTMDVVIWIVTLYLVHTVHSVKGIYVYMSIMCNFFGMEELYSYKEKNSTKKTNQGNKIQQHNNKKIYNYVQL